MRGLQALATAVALSLAAAAATAADGGTDTLRVLIEDDTVSTVHAVGDLSYVYRADGSHAVFQRVGEVSLVTDSRPGMSGTAYHLGDTVIIVRGNAADHCSLANEVLRCHRQWQVAGR